MGFEDIERKEEERDFKKKIKIEKRVLIREE